ncbi:MAG TPA: response regulator [bacterium]|nr:response regulator [bacterium]
MSGQVKGVLFRDYVRMIRKRKDVDWGPHLTDDDRELLSQLILPASWYPMESYQRMGAAIYREVAHGDPGTARAWGRAGMEELASLYVGHLIKKGSPRETLENFKAIHRRFFDFEGFDIDVVGDNHIYVIVEPEFGPYEVEGYSTQMLGSFERLFELAGAAGLKAEFRNRSWEGAGKTVIELKWDHAEDPDRRAERAAGKKSPLRIMVIDDDANTCRIAQIILSKAGYEVQTRTQALGSSVAIKSFKPDLVLLDVQMPGLSGDHLAGLITPLDPRPKIIFYSNKSPQDLRELVKKTSADGYACKVDGPSVLLNTVNNALGKTL